MIGIRYAKFVALTQPQESGASMPLIGDQGPIVRNGGSIWEGLCGDDGIILLLESQDH